MNNDGSANIKGHAAEIIIGNYTGVWCFFHSNYYIWWIIYSDYVHAFTTYENGNSLCRTLPDCCHYVDRNNGSNVMLWKICTSTSSFALNADSDPVMTVFKRSETNETISLVNNFSEPKVELVSSREHIISPLYSFSIYILYSDFLRKVNLPDMWDKRGNF